MPIYLVIPRDPAAAAAVDLSARLLAPDARARQVADLAQLRTEDPVSWEIDRWVAEHEAATPLNRAEEAVVTGTRLVEMDPEAASRMETELPDVLVVPDRPLPLIRPRHRETASTVTRNEVDAWHLDSIGLTVARRDGLRETGRGVRIAVLDTGIDDTHSEIQGKVSASFEIDRSRNEVVQIPNSHDTEGHGTHVAGLIVGRTVGIAPDADLVNLIMIPAGHGRVSDFVIAMEWAARQPRIQIVNMSAGKRGFHVEMRASSAGLLAAGVLPVFATGNEGRDRTRSPGNFPEPLSVGASTKFGRVATFSSGGTLVVDNQQYHVPDLVAPGEGVFSCVMGGGFEAWDGTSMATPIVSGAAALILERHPTIPVLDLIEELLNSCTDLGVQRDRQGKGLVQVIKP